MAFKARTTEPSTTDKHWIHTSKGGLNECILIKGNSCIPNCVGYAWGRAYEILGSKPKLSKANAENWYVTSDGYHRSQTPSLGAIVCWAKGVVGNAADGAGHVAVVEEIKSNGDIVTSNSGYNTKRFWMQTFTKASKYSMNGYTFQGFIHILGASNTTTPSSSTASATFVSSKSNITNTSAKAMNQSLSGTYVVTAADGLWVRSTPGVIDKSTEMVLLPKNTKVQNYGYYTTINDVRWLYVQANYNGIKYIGFSSSAYLKKQ